MQAAATPSIIFLIVFIISLSFSIVSLSTSFLDKLRHNENVEIRSLDILCSILDCDFGDIVEHIPDNAEPEEK